MPSKNSVKLYVENGYYHIYNRGVEKRIIFNDKSDCAVFLHYLKLYLLPIEDLKKLQANPQENLKLSRFIPLNLSGEIDLIAFALMPNHIHLLAKQKTKDAMTKLMRRVCTSYVMYFNKKYKRVGSLFQNKYKAILVESDDYLLHLSRYIHLNSSKIKSNLDFSEFSSYPYYLGYKNASWIKPKEILDYFKSSDNSGNKTYKNFVEDFTINSQEKLQDLILEDPEE